MSLGKKREAWLGYLQDYPDYWTQGETSDDLKEHLRDLMRIESAVKYRRNSQS